MISPLYTAAHFRSTTKKLLLLSVRHLFPHNIQTRKRTYTMMRRYAQPRYIIVSRDTQTIKIHSLNYRGAEHKSEEMYERQSDKVLVADLMEPSLERVEAGGRSGNHRVNSWKSARCAVRLVSLFRCIWGSRSLLGPSFAIRFIQTKPGSWPQRYIRPMFA